MISTLIERIRHAKRQTLVRMREHQRWAEEETERLRTKHYADELDLVHEYMQTVIEHLTLEKIVSVFDHGSREYELRVWGWYYPRDIQMDEAMASRFISENLSLPFTCDYGERTSEYSAEERFRQNILRTDYPLGAHLAGLVEQGLTVEEIGRA